MLNISDFNNNLLVWYQANKRDLPWRRTSDPYRIWLSEVMLQQTQVITVIPYFEKFITNYPDIDSLADADEGRLLKDWEGLGYYNRIRNFQTAVKEVQNTYDSKVPDDPDAFFSLKGVGPYIGGAVQSIAFNNLLAAVDGNVLRVMARLNLDYRDMTKASVQKSVKQNIEAIMPLEAGDFNQALMELGATICTPRAPKCIMCPVQGHCEAYKAGEVASLPVKKKAKAKKEIYYNVYFILNDNEEIILRKQEGTLLQGMYELPKYDIDTSVESIEEELGLTLDHPNLHVGSVKHVFTHQVWYMEGYVLYTKDAHPDFISLNEVEKLPMSKAMQKIYRQFEG
ncbi:A/G-specific adenine glycosylase [Salinicoccus halodurans]|uniref:Adenine DNA glycosylase n=1 Tax=Salinicoccus halodurans TaxID=407035 RepID=A0A0F7HLI4_9STAP|nr:A/G-specific adenine glycosylase [Salinicoccus halodurans]AKG74472.1 adenine glycosylase [Salinicoccus halodurans]SFK91093.1 A/G-specific DNA-adenine glycosylase [Salinicoccus halodurans]